MIVASLRSRIEALRALSSSERQRLRRGLTRGLDRAMQAAGVGAGEVSLSLVGDEEIHALNRTWRDEDKPTDVLSFSQRDEHLSARQRSRPAEAGEPLGDIVISVDTAARQAAARGASLDAELLHLAVHGLAHLLGYDHATPDEERVMFGWEARLREQAEGRGAVRPAPPPL